MARSAVSVAEIRAPMVWRIALSSAFSRSMRLESTKQVTMVATSRQATRTSAIRVMVMG